MAPRFKRRRRADHEEDQSTATDDVAHLDDDQHAWWAKRDVEEPWTPPEAHESGTEKERDVLAEHFGEDWRTSILFEPVATPPADPIETEPAAPADPYAVLEIEPSATWEEIVEARRRMARHHHPDRLVGRSEADSVAGEDRIRAINAAYAELKVRRGK